MINRASYFFFFASSFISSERRRWFLGDGPRSEHALCKQMGGESLRATPSKPRRLLSVDVKHELMEAKTKWSERTSA